MCNSVNDLSSLESRKKRETLIFDSRESGITSVGPIAIGRISDLADGEASVDTDLVVRKDKSLFSWLPSCLYRIINNLTSWRLKTEFFFCLYETYFLDFIKSLFYNGILLSFSSRLCRKLLNWNYHLILYIYVYKFISLL